MHFFTCNFNDLQIENKRQLRNKQLRKCSKIKKKLPIEMSERKYASKSIHTFFLGNPYKIDGPNLCPGPDNWFTLVKDLDRWSSTESDLQWSKYIKLICKLK